MEHKWSVGRLGEGGWHKFVLNTGPGGREMLDTYCRAVRSAMFRLPGDLMIHPQKRDEIIVIGVNDEIAVEAIREILPEASYRGIVKLRGEQRASLKYVVVESPPA